MRRWSRRRHRSLIAAWSLLLFGRAVPGAAQPSNGNAAAGVPRRPRPAIAAMHTRRDTTTASEGVRAARPAPLWAPLASLAVPGAGQIALRQPRAAAYLGLEVFEWIQLLESRREAHRLRGEYRRLAREVARNPFGGARPDGSWPYYEAMEEYAASGAFSVSAGDIVPEPDETTFNGVLWRKARTLYWIDADQAPPRSDPSFQRALDWYTRQAIRDEFAWTWRNAEISRADYQATIGHYNGATRDVRAALGIILANHLVSGIDAFAAVRLRRDRGPSGEQRIDVTVPLEVFGPRRGPGR
jgi:hypothetical protein